MDELQRMVLVALGLSAFTQGQLSKFAIHFFIISTQLGSCRASCGVNATVEGTAEFIPTVLAASCPAQGTRGMSDGKQFRERTAHDGLDPCWYFQRCAHQVAPARERWPLIISNVRLLIGFSLLKNSTRFATGK
jgi:hypothetical protein